MSSSSGFFPLRWSESTWREIEPRGYERTISVRGTVLAFVQAYALRLSGLREVTHRCSGLLHTKNFSSLSGVLGRASMAAFARQFVEALESRHQPGKGELVAVDGMAVTLSKTQRHSCAKFNNKTVGGGVIWAFSINARAGRCPVQVLRVIEGAWHDGKSMLGVALRCGPVYLMDRGFYTLQLLEEWLTQKVRFVVRAKASSLVYETLEARDHPARIQSIRVEFDGRVRLGGPRAKAHPVLRLIRAVLPNGEALILATTEWSWTTAQVLEAYRKRWQIERFHRFLKETLGLAHLYSFRQNGLVFLVYTALMLALLVFLAEDDAKELTVDIMRRALIELREAFGLGSVWRRNTFAPKKAKKRKYL